MALGLMNGLSMASHVRLLPAFQCSCLPAHHCPPAAGQAGQNPDAKATPFYQNAWPVTVPAGFLQWLVSGGGGVVGIFFYSTSLRAHHATSPRGGSVTKRPRLTLLERKVLEGAASREPARSTLRFLSHSFPKPNRTRR